MQKLIQHIGLLVALIAPPAHAYIGPGAGAGIIAVVFGVIASIFLAFVAVLWYPLKRLFARRKAPSKKAEDTVQSENNLETERENRSAEKDAAGNAVHTPPDAE